MTDTCEYCHELLTSHVAGDIIDGVVTCNVNGLTIRTETSDRAEGRITGSDQSPAGEASTSSPRSSGAHATADGRHLTVRELGRINDLPAKVWLDYRDALAQWRANHGEQPKPGLHSVQCPNAEDSRHSANCVIDTRMHGAVLVRPTGERVAA